MERLTASGVSACAEWPRGIAVLLMDPPGAPGTPLWTQTLERALDLLGHAPELSGALLVASVEAPLPRHRLPRSLRASPLGRALARLGWGGLTQALSEALFHPLLEALPEAEGAAVAGHGARIGALAEGIPGGAGPEGRLLYVAGLLHDAGQLVLGRHGGDAYRTLREAAGEGAALCALEAEVLGFDHGALGEALLIGLGLPRPLASLVRDHHHFEARQGQMPMGTHLRRLARLSIAQTLEARGDAAVGRGWGQRSPASRASGRLGGDHWAVSIP